MKRLNLKKYFQFLLIVLAAGSIYPMIYLRTNYQQTILEVFNMKIGQLNTIYTALGFAYIIGYFPSGWLADKFSAKKLLSLSLFMTGFAGLWYAQIPSYSSVIFIFIVWGIFSVFTFWAAHLKIVKIIAGEEDGKFFGMLDGGRGLIEALLASFAVIIFTYFAGNDINLVSQKIALVKVIQMYSYILIILSVLIWIFIKSDSSNKSKEENENFSEDNNTVVEMSSKNKIIEILKNRLIIVMGVIIFLSYTVTWSVYYLGGFLQNNIGFNAALAAKATVYMMWMRPIGGVVGGYLGDKVGKTKVLATSLLLSAIFLMIIVVAPNSFGNLFFMVGINLIGLMIYAIRGLYWSLLGDCKIENNLLGTAIGVVSFIGYLPDLLIPMINTELFNAFGPSGGYNAYFIMNAISAIISVILIVYFNKLRKTKI